MRKTRRSMSRGATLGWLDHAFGVNPLILDSADSTP